MQELGLTVSSKKLVPPATQVTCLGIVVNTEDFSLSIPAEKLSQIKQLCKKWANKMVCTKRELQSLLGSLLYVAKCIKYARFFLNRMLTFYVSLYHQKLPKHMTDCRSFLQELGLTVSSKKLVPPATQVTCLGIVVNTEDFSLSIPAEKLSQIKQLCKKWANKMVCTKRELQSLLGSLLYVAKCIKYARCFLNRMLTLLRENFDKKSITVTADFKKDLNWFNTFLSVYNGVSFFQHVTGKVVHLDACPQGLGAIFDNQVYALPLPFTYHQLNIAYLEMLNILVALKVWHREWAGARIQVKCDNQDVVSVLNSGRSRDSVMAEYARNIFMWVSTFNIDIKVVHVPGKLNEVADLLSRWFITKNNVKKLHHLVHPVIWIPVSNALLYTDKTNIMMVNMFCFVILGSSLLESQLAS